MSYLTAAHWLFFAMLLLLVREWVAQRVMGPTLKPLLSPPRQRLALLLMLLLVLALGLSGCGTAPSRASTRPPVPAELLIPPQKPVLLTPGLGLKPPGPTTQPTLKAARKTD